MIETVPETGSTNVDLIERLRAGEGLEEGYWLIADRQNGGKGRQGKPWADAVGNFMGSTVIRLTGQEEGPSYLPLLASVALYEAVLPHLTSPGRLLLKWPNDLMLSGAKLAGILLERVGNTVVVGFGVNLAAAPRIAGRTSISLGDLGPAPDRDLFSIDLAKAFAAELAHWRETGIGPLRARWLAAAYPEGTPLSVHAPDGSIVSGEFDGLTQDGALRLRLADGSHRVIHAGDVSLDRS